MILGTKLRSKNYASPDCGAKIVAANPEAVSPSSVLSPSRDEYKLNTCTSRIWFIVELCEAVQAKKIDLANFELFSSSPKDFTVSISDRFPTREWSLVGQFTAKDERDIQSFDLYPHLFGRYMKVEIKSHYGSEHFCPISLFRVYGTSEFEVLEKEDQVNANTLEDDVDDETLDCIDGETPKNLFSSATDAVISIVKKAAEVLGNKGNTSNQTIKLDHTKNTQNVSEFSNYCITPSYLIVCDNCNNESFKNIYNLLSCHARVLMNLLKSSFIKNSLRHSDICKDFGLDFTKNISKACHACDYYISYFFSTEYLGALCNTLAIDEQKVVFNTTHQFANNTTTINNSDINTEPFDTVSSEVILSTKHQPKHEEIVPTDALSTDDDIVKLTDTLTGVDTVITSKIKPTKTLSPDDNLSISPEEEMITIQPTDFVKSEVSINSETEKWKASTSVSSVEVESVSKNETVVETEGAMPENTETVEEVLEEFNSEAGGVSGQMGTQHNIPAQAQKESVFLRLSNRIKVKVTFVIL